MTLPASPPLLFLLLLVWVPFFPPLFLALPVLCACGAAVFAVVLPRFVLLWGLLCSLLWQRSPPPARPTGCSFVAFWSSKLLLVPPSGYLVVSYDGPVAMPCGLDCRSALLPLYTSSHGNKGFGPVWGSALSTMLRVLFRCLAFLH